jgi:hypothetical protein
MGYYCRLLVIVDTSSATIYIWGCLNGNINVASNVATKSTFELRLTYGQWHWRRCFKNCRISVIIPPLTSCAINPDVVYFPLNDQVLTFCFKTRAELKISNSFCRVNNKLKQSALCFRVFLNNCSFLVDQSKRSLYVSCDVTRRFPTISPNNKPINITKFLDKWD